MAFNKNERLEEWGLMTGDLIVSISRGWWISLSIGIVAVIPAYYLMKFLFVQSLIASHEVPAIVYTSAVKQPLTVIDQKVFTLGPNTYSGYVRVKNTNLEWGVSEQSYTAEFKTFGGTVLTKVNGTTFILPASEKLIVFARFTSENKPDEIAFSLGDTKFTHKPDLAVNYELERITIANNPSGALISAGIKNLSAFTVKQINLPVAVYNNKNEIVGVNSTYINDVLSGETRAFQYIWPGSLPGAVRAEVNAEINIFDRGILATDKGISPFEQQ
jgi:hypothetical protein